MSEWRESATKRRDYRHDHSLPTPENRRGRKHSTVKWCRGRTGVPHAWDSPAWGRYAWAFRSKTEHRELTCQNCGKLKYQSRPISGEPPG